MAANYQSTLELFHRGKYKLAASVAAEEVERGVWNERWSRLLIQCHLVTGQYDDAVQTYETAIKRYTTSLTLRLLGIESYRLSGRIDLAEKAEIDFANRLQASSSGYISRDSLVAAGRYFADQGEDARQVLKLFYDRVLDSDPTFVEAIIATAELAIEKGDYQVAVDSLKEAARQSQTDPRIPYLSARAWMYSDSKKFEAAINQALTLNGSHIPTLLLLAENQIDAEKYDEAADSIAKILGINLDQPLAWALSAVIDHVYGHYTIEQLKRNTALSVWKSNPEVDHLIGRKLSDKYRFAEGAAYQRLALAKDPNHVPAKFQLSQDLLRLGIDDEGWKLADQVTQQDPYNVVAYNLMTLKDRLDQMTTIQRDGIVVRMNAREASIYGMEAVDLLLEAKNKLARKYDIKIDAPIIVEIYAKQSDFAIRTFGLPGGAGFLGVCFGRVITANSPASQGQSPSNWKSVLWHEFCHVVTLEKTRNRMPRWLSEGISVYEERQRDPAWGEAISPTYRRWITGGQMTPVADLSSAFLTPATPMHLQFAYYQSSLVVEFLVDRFGHASLLAVLDDLRDGTSISDALVRHYGSPGKLQADFESFAKAVANQYGSTLNWDQQLSISELSAPQRANFLQTFPNHHDAMLAVARDLLRSKDYSQALQILRRLQLQGAASGAPGGTLSMLAKIYRELGIPNKEEAVLRQIVELRSNPIDALLRLVSLDRKNKDWTKMRIDAKRILAINPMRIDGHKAMAEAAEKTADHADASRALNAIGEFDPIDPAGWHFRLASTYEKLEQKSKAIHHVLMALDEAPRYRDAHRLLLDLQGSAELE